MVTEAQLNDFIAGCSRISGSDYSFSFDNSKGSKFVRIVREGGCQRSVHCFIDRQTGDVLKAAGWKAPAKHARGNLFDAKQGLGLMGPYGPAYLR